MKKLKIFVLIFLSFVVGFFISQGVSLYQKNLKEPLFGKTFSEERVKIKISINQNVPLEIKELAEMITEQYVYLLNGAVATEKKECLMIISEALEEATVKNIRIIQQELETVQSPKPSTKKSII